MLPMYAHPVPMIYGEGIATSTKCRAIGADRQPIYLNKYMNEYINIDPFS
jgi:hypothetical protein